MYFMSSIQSSEISVFRNQNKQNLEDQNNFWGNCCQSVEGNCMVLAPRQF